MKNNIPELLKNSELSISKLGRLADVSYPTIQNLCTLDYLPNVEMDTLKRIAGVLDCRVCDLFEEEACNGRS
jgi:DNA-binding Xre family transcriptional regulator